MLGAAIACLSGARASGVRLSARWKRLCGPTGITNRPTYWYPWPAPADRQRLMREDSSLRNRLWAKRSRPSPFAAEPLSPSSECRAATINCCPGRLRSGCSTGELPIAEARARVDGPAQTAVRSISRFHGLPIRSNPGSRHYWSANEQPRVEPPLYLDAPVRRARR